MVLYKAYSALPYNEKEILRYAGCKDADDAVRALLGACRAEAEGKLSYKVCYLPLHVTVEDDLCDFGVLSVRSADLARNLRGCTEAAVFAATVGVGAERLIAKYSAHSPAKALLFDAIGTERIETLCDRFCADLQAEKPMHARPRFSPGYGDLPLSFQKEIFSVLQCEKHIGLTVTESLMMSPSKSVTAIVGFGDTACEKPGEKCAGCGNKECTFRSSL